MAERAEKDLSTLRNLKMARSAHAYVRGSTVQFYEWVNTLQAGVLPEGPPIWICGDCHVGNLGPVADTHGDIAIQIRDLDQTVIGNPAHDLIRLGLSLASAARGFDLSGVTIAKMVEQLVEGYVDAFEADHDVHALEAPACVKFVMRKSAKRTWEELAKERIKDAKPTIPLGKTFWRLTAEESEAIRECFQGEAMRNLATALSCRADDAEVEVLDAAFWVKGCSSLGLKRFAVLLGIDSGSKESTYCLMDCKEAVKAVAPHYPGQAMPKDEAERVVTGARHLSPYLGDRMRATSLVGRSMFVRELLPQDLKVEISKLSVEDAMRTARLLAAVVGRAHVRQMDAADRASWKTELTNRYPTKLDAPSWLWSSIVQLLMIHEGAYLEHCRVFAMGKAS